MADLLENVHAPFGIGQKALRSGKRILLLLTAMLFSVLGGAAGVIDHSQLFQDAYGGDGEAQYTLAHLLLKGRGGMAIDVGSATAWFEKAAKNGHRDAAFDLAMLYLKGESVDKNDAQALLWITTAAELGQIEAQYYLGLAYRKTNPEKAVFWLEKARDGGHVASGRALADFCEKEGLCR